MLTQFAKHSNSTWRKSLYAPNGECDRLQEDRGMEIRIYGLGGVTIEELEARLSAYMNAGAPEPVIEGTPEEREAILKHVAARGDSQMRALVDIYLKS